MLGKAAKDVVDANSEMENDFPFAIKSIRSDCGTEFINETMIERFKNRLEAQIDLYRSRPYKKNDNAHIEQKNNVFVRELFGYTRIESPAVIERMNRIYKNLWQDLHNYYLPQTQTLEKKRVGAKIKRTLSKAITPCERLLASEKVSESVKGKLLEEKMQINPWTIKTELRLAMSKLWRHFVINNRWTQETYNVG